NVVAQFSGRGELPPRDVVERQVLERLILIRLQLQRAESTGIRVSDAELDQAVMRLAQQNNATLDQLRATLERDGFSYDEFRRTMRDELMVQRLRQRFVQSRVNVTDTEVDILLASDSLKRGEVRLSHILVGVPENATPQQLQAAREKADRVKAEIDGGLDFSAAAIRYSDGQQALEGGDLGWRRYNEVPQVFSDLVQGLQKGQVTQPLRGPSGFHILKLVDERTESKEMVREFHARHIMVKTSELVSSDEALASVKNLRTRIESGEDFGELAKEFSEDNTSKQQGGDMGWFEQGAYGSRVSDVLSTLEDGELSEPFQTEIGWHIMQRLGTRDQDKTEQVAREQARTMLRNRKAEEEYDAFLRQMKSESYVENRLTNDVTKEVGSSDADSAEDAESDQASSG
ncbi:MAG TPA: peptidylprolyl isomerase, partial [Xanthomonadales bacterium]|nr:peptidylprolyl isomerase [Xanthomonadales bacterium]